MRFRLSQHSIRHYCIIYNANTLILSPISRYTAKSINIKEFFDKFHLFQKIDGNVVTFDDDEKAEYDTILLCTGYNIGIPFLDKEIRSKIFTDESETVLKVIRGKDFVKVFIVFRFLLSFIKMYSSLKSAHHCHLLALHNQQAVVFCQVF